MVKCLFHHIFIVQTFTYPQSLGKNEMASHNKKPNQTKLFMDLEVK